MLLLAGCVTTVPVERVEVIESCFGAPPLPQTIAACALDHDVVVVDPAGHPIEGAEVRARVLVLLHPTERPRTFDYASHVVLTDVSGHASVCDPAELLQDETGKAGLSGDGAIATGRRIEVRKDNRSIEAPPLWGGTMMVVLPAAPASP